VVCLLARVGGRPQGPTGISPGYAYWEARLGGKLALWRGFRAAITLANLCLLPATLLFFPSMLAVYALLDELLIVAVVLPASIFDCSRPTGGHLEYLKVHAVNQPTTAGGQTGRPALPRLGKAASYLIGARWLGTIFAVPLLGLTWAHAGAGWLAVRCPRP